MTSSPDGGRRGLQIVLGTLSLIPFASGAAGVLVGPRALPGVDGPVPTDLDSEYRYVHAMWFTAAPILWWALPRIEREAAALQAVSAAVFLGGVARLVSWRASGRRTRSSSAPRPSSWRASPSCWPGRSASPASHAADRGHVSAVRSTAASIAVKPASSAPGTPASNRSRVATWSVDRLVHQPPGPGQLHDAVAAVGRVRPADDQPPLLQPLQAVGGRRGREHQGAGQVTGESR